MLQRRMLKIVLLVFCIAALCLVIAFSGVTKQPRCMGIPLMEAAQLGAYTESNTLDALGLAFNGEKAAVDQKTNTVYISQASNNLSHYALLEGVLHHSNPSYSLYVLQDSALDDLQNAVSGNKPLTLVITKDGLYQKINLTLTTLPVLRINGDATGQTDEAGRQILAGDFTLWAGFDPLLEQYSSRSGSLHFHIRGNSSAATAKPPWKLSVKNSKGNSKDVSFLDLGTDDDWILNSLTFDDTRLREKFFTDLWNSNAETAQWNYKMTSGAYTEVVMNGQYLGLFLLQRRVDTKYLNLSKDDILLKSSTYNAPSPSVAYEIISKDTDPDTAYDIMQPVFDGTDCRVYDLNNLIDTNLLLQLASAHDNFGEKNVFHVLKNNGEAYRHYLIPWDTDMSFGVHIRPDVGFCYDYDTSVSMFALRAETASLHDVTEEYERGAALRWQELRNTLLQEDALLSQIDALANQLNGSGALTRDKALWGDRYGKADTVDQLKTFISQRLAFLDTQYSQ